LFSSPQELNMVRLLPKEVPAMRSLPEFVVEPIADALLPWGDPYIIKLAQALEREAREQIEAAFRETEEDWDAADFGQHDPLARRGLNRMATWAVR
jgi:hypothetical protein